MDISIILILPIHMREISVYLYHIQFLSSLSCSFQYPDLSPLWLNLFLHGLFFLRQLQTGLFISPDNSLVTSSCFLGNSWTYLKWEMGRTQDSILLLLSSLYLPTGTPSCPLYPPNLLHTLCLLVFCLHLFFEQMFNFLPLCTR